MAFVELFTSDLPYVTSSFLVFSCNGMPDRFLIVNRMRFLIDSAKTRRDLWL